MYGKTGVISDVSKIVTPAASGSTTPEPNPYRNALRRVSPLDSNGVEMIAPSGKF